MALDVMRQLSLKLAQTHKRYEEVRRAYEETRRQLQRYEPDEHG